MKKGNQIRKYRRAAGMTQTDLAAYLDCEQSTISNYERGDRTPGLDEIRLMVSAFKDRGVNTSIDDLFPEGQEVSAA